MKRQRAKELEARAPEPAAQSAQSKSKTKTKVITKPNEEDKIAALSAAANDIVSISVKTRLLATFTLTTNMQIEVSCEDRENHNLCCFSMAAA